MTTHLDLDTARVRENFPDRPFPIRHNLVGNPLLDLEALAALAGTLPGDRIEYNSGKVAVHQRPEDTPAVDMTPQDVVKRIETANAWLVLKNVEAIPAYKAMLEQCLTDVARASGFEDLDDAGISDVQGFIFVSSANSTTPFHVDYEHNFFVHIAGPKVMHIFDNEDRSLVSEEALETSPGKHRNLFYEEGFEARAEVYEMAGGQGVFLPYTWPHWVKTGDHFAISMAITWKTREIIARNKLLTANAMLRKACLPQPAPGRYRALDGAKVAALTAARAMLEPLRRSERSRRVLRGMLFGAKANYYYRNKKAA